MTFEEFVVGVALAQAALADYAHRNENYRAGQVAFNCLAEERPDLAEQIAGEDIDPYYDNDKLPAFYAWVAEHWSN